MRYERVANDKMAFQIQNEMLSIPREFIKITDEFGLKIYCFNKEFKPSWIGLVDKNALFSDGERYEDETSAYYSSEKAIFIFDDDMKPFGKEKAFSTFLHEYGHALDHALGMKNRKNNFCSYVDSNIYDGWKSQKGLDWYANINPEEYFAQAFMAYMQDKGSYDPWSYREHTRLELKEKDRNMFEYFKALGVR